MGLVRTRTLVMCLVAAGIVYVLFMDSLSVRIQLGDPDPMTGYWLYGVMVFLAVFNLRKRLSMLPLGNASTWLMLHVIGGVLALAIFWLHAGTIWPTGAYEKVLATLFYLTTLSGIGGFFLQRIYPPLLSQTGIEIIYERIPTHLDVLRRRAEAVVREFCAETQLDTLGRHYLDTLEWFFYRPRFALGHMVRSQRSRQRLRQQDEAVRRYLNEAERVYLDELTELALEKDSIDLHYTLQRVMKLWLLAHVPLTAALMALGTWHLVVVNVYSP
jgi:hypothetical protein